MATLGDIADGPLWAVQTAITDITRHRDVLKRRFLRNDLTPRRS
jgi:hypothetical protein